MSTQLSSLRRSSLERESFATQFTSLYPLMACALGVLLMKVQRLDGPGTNPWLEYVPLGCLGAYALLRAASSFRPLPGLTGARRVLVSDLVVCTMPVLLTGGLESPFLLCAITPVLWATSHFRRRIALLAASLVLVAVMAGHVMPSPWSVANAPVAPGDYWVWLLSFAALCFLAANMSYEFNTGLRRDAEAQAVLGERARLRRELHDTLAQRLGYLRFKAHSAEGSLRASDAVRAISTLNEMQDALRDAYLDVRRCIDSLSQTCDVPLEQTLSQHVRRFAEETDIEARLVVSGIQPSLPTTEKQELLQISREALSNVSRHSEATEVVVELNSSRDSVEMVVRDNGRGIPVSPQARGGHVHHGLSVMKERAERVGGTLLVQSDVGQGTQVRVSIPVAKARL